MKKLIPLTTLLILLYTQAYAQTYRVKEEDKHKIEISIRSPESIKLPSYPLNQAKELYEQGYGGDRTTLESMCEYQNPMGIVKYSVTQYKIRKALKKPSNFFQKMIQYFIGIKIKTEKIKKYFQVKF